MSRRLRRWYGACLLALLALPVLADTRVTLSKDAVGPGETARIFTGAAMPEGADTVMVQEEIAASGTARRTEATMPSNAARNGKRARCGGKVSADQFVSA